MELPDGRPLIVDGGVLCETSSGGRILLWVPGERDGGYQHWDRVGAAARGRVTTAEGVCSVEAASVPARQRLGGSLGKLLRALTGPRAPRTWALPGGATAEACGARRADLRLAWAEDEAAPLDEARVKALWPGCGDARALGRNLFLVSGVGPERHRAGDGPAAEATPPPPQDTPRALAERALTSARAGGDPHRVVEAENDLGLAVLYEGDAQAAARLIKGALDGARRLGDPALEADALGHFALAAQALGHSGRARDLLGSVLTYARAVGDRYAEKLALDRLAVALLGLGDHAGSLACLEQARGLASEAGDRRHEADLLWRSAVQYAELGRRDQALGAGAAAVDRLRRLDNPTADWYAMHLAHYRSGASGQPRLGGGDAPSFGGPVDSAAPGSRHAAPAGVTGPGLLRMAQTAAKAMAAFVGSGFKTAPAEAYRGRLAACATCEHHTGVRCRVCGCVTAAKARLLHERCPTGRWPV